MVNRSIRGSPALILSIIVLGSMVMARQPRNLSLLDDVVFPTSIEGSTWHRSKNVAFDAV